MPLLGNNSKQVLPPIKNPAFSLTDKTSVVVSQHEEAVKSHDRLKKSDAKVQKSGRFSGFVNPFKKRPKSTISAGSPQSLDDVMSPNADRKIAIGKSAMTINQDKPKETKNISLDTAQERLVNENRKSPRQRTPLPLENMNGERQQNEIKHLTMQDDSARFLSPASSPGLNNITSIESLSEIITNARAADCYDEVGGFLTATFDSYASISRIFKEAGEYKDTYEIRINFDYLEYVYDTIRQLPKEVQKLSLKSIINCLLKNLRRPGNIDDLRAMIILLTNPQFLEVSTYTIFAHLLRVVSSLQEPDQRTIMYWFRRIPVQNFKKIITCIHKFILERLFPTKVSDMPPVEKCRWWIQTAVKVLALLNSANWSDHPQLVQHTFFYCDAIDKLDLMREYDTWQRQTGRFSFCQYPFLLSLGSKRFIMQKDSEMKMLFEARESIVKQVKRREMPSMGMLFLNLKIRRSHLVYDSLDEIAAKKKDLKKKLRVSFEGEPGLDLGGLTKEWFLLLIRKIFREEYGMFTYNNKVRSWWFNSASTETEQEFNLLGVLMGLAVYNGINLDIRLPLCCYKKLLSPAVVPFHNPHAPVGIATLSLEDLSDVNPELAHGLKELLSYEGDVENDLFQTFQISYKSYGEVVTKDLKKNGSQIPVTNENREEYVKLYINYILNKSIYKQFYAFYHGFHSVCASNALILLRPEEVEMLVCGDPNLDIEALQRVTIYDGFAKNDPVIRRFWEVVVAMPLQLKKKLLLFTTGSDRVPAGGMSEMKFKITRMQGANVDKMLPMAHTCFNQLILPTYRSKKALKQKLIVAISNSEGFGIE